METFFDHNPTPQERKSLIGELSKNSYLESLSYAPKGENLLFIALLYKQRGDNLTFEEYKSQVPELYQEWILGFDNDIIPVVR